MPTNAPISLADAAATPVVHVFSPIGIDASGIATFKERTSGVPIGYPVLTVSMKDPVGTSPVYRGRIQLSLPTVITSTDTAGKSVTSVDYTIVATLDLQIPVKSTLQNRKDAAKLMANALSNTAIQSVIQDLERFW